MDRVEGIIVEICLFDEDFRIEGVSRLLDSKKSEENAMQRLRGIDHQMFKFILSVPIDG